MQHCTYQIQFCALYFFQFFILKALSPCPPVRFENFVMWNTRIEYIRMDDVRSNALGDLGDHFTQSAGRKYDDKSWF